MGTTDDMFVRKDIPLKMTKEEKEKFYKEEARIWHEKDAKANVDTVAKDEFTYKRSELFVHNSKQKDEL